MKLMRLQKSTGRSAMSSSVDTSARSVPNDSIQHQRASQRVECRFVVQDWVDSVFMHFTSWRADIEVNHETAKGQ